MCLKIYKLALQIFFQLQDYHGSSFKKKTQIKLDLLDGIDILLMVKKGIRGGICHSIYIYAKVNNKYMKDYDKESSYLQYCDENNLCK